MERLMAYDWPGNIRELENSVKYILATVSGEVVDLGDLPPNIQRPAAPGPGDAPETNAPPPGRDQAPAGGEGAGLFEAFAGLSWVEVERAYVNYLLEKTKWNVTKSAEEARVKRSTFVSRMKRLGIGRD
jgi:DNA-binding NtrC family response regulator